MNYIFSLLHIKPIIINNDRIMPKPIARNIVLELINIAIITKCITEKL